MKVSKIKNFGNFQSFVTRFSSLDEHYLFESTSEFHKASCSSLYLQCGVQEDNSNVFIDLVSQILVEPCYNELRTKQQLGYIVYSGARKANGAKGLRVIVQSTKHPAYVEQRIEDFLKSMIVSFTTSRFRKSRSRLNLFSLSFVDGN